MEVLIDTKLAEEQKDSIKLKVSIILKYLIW